MTKLTKQEKQELAEFVAFKMFNMRPWEQGLLPHDVINIILHDSQFLPLVRDMRERGWIFKWDLDTFQFSKYTPSKISKNLTGWTRTKTFSTEDYGHMIALCLAVMEAVEMEEV
jgi:hypothetical protein